MAWNAFVKHQKWFITEKDIDPKYWEIKNNSGNDSFRQLKEIHVIRRLIAYYLDNIQNNGYLAGAVLFSKYAKLLKAKKESPQYLRPYSPAQELLDPYLIEYACSGLYVNDILQRKKIIIITCEKFSQAKISDYIDAKKKINNDLEKIGIKAKPFMPGYIIIIDDKHRVYKNIIDISKLI